MEAWQKRRPFHGECLVCSDLFQQKGEEELPQQQGQVQPLGMAQSMSKAAAGPPHSRGF